MRRISIPFELRPVAEIEPWGDTEKGLWLSWFGLTDGWYDLVIGEHRLFSGPDGDTRGVDYQVVRIWEDLIAVAPYALEEVPAALADRLRHSDAWQAWCCQIRDTEEWPDDVIELAMSWWWQRQLGSHHLNGAPCLDLWCHGDDLHIRWRSSPPSPHAFVWSSPSGDAVASAAAFRDELLRFDRALIASMQRRVDDVVAGALRPAITIDVGALRREQAERATWLDRELSRLPATSWDDVIAAVVELERRLGSS
jgi:hypothetical protein